MFRRNSIMDNSCKINTGYSLYLFFAALMFMPFLFTAQAATLEERAVYTVKILPGGDPAEVGQCSGFSFGNVSAICGTAVGPLVDNTAPGAPTLSGGDGIAGDGLAGAMSIETSKADALGNLTYTVDDFQMDPYLSTPGGTFKTTMTPPDGAMTGTGTIDAAGNMDLDITGRTGVAQFFEGPIGIQPWNIDDSAVVEGNGDPTTSVWETFTTSSATNFDPSAGGPLLTLTGRPIGDANADNILDAVLISVGNVGRLWQAFDGTPYSEAFNVQFELVSAKPVANPDSVNTTRDTPLVIDEANDLLANDTHATGDPLTVVGFTQPTQAGSVVVDNGNGTLTYSPAAGFFGVDTFDYTIEDTANEQDTTTVTVNVSDVGNTPPVANDFPVVTDEDVPATFDPTVNDTDDDGDPLTITAFDNATNEGGAVVDNGGNSLTYTPLPNFNGADSFSYTISDGNGGQDSANVLITVNVVNDSLVCADVILNTDTDTPLDIDADNDLLVTCTDPEDDPITLDSYTQPIQAGSMVTDNSAGTLTYTPAAGFLGIDSFTYTATDGVSLDTRTVTVEVGKVFGNFTMLDAGGTTFGGTNDVTATWDGSLNTDESDTNFNMSMGSDSNFPFFGFVWTAHDIRVFGPGSYSFDTSCSVAQIQSGLSGDCGNSCDTSPQNAGCLNLDIPVGMIGAHMLFDWNVTADIDIGLLWDMNGEFTNPDPAGSLYLGPAGPTPPTDCVYELVSRDADGDTVPGAKMIDGPFIGFRANFNLNFTRGCTDTDPVDLDIKQFKASKTVKLGKKQVSISLTVSNNSAVDEPASAQVIGIQNGGIIVYNEIISVSDTPGNGSTRWDFPAYNPAMTGVIDWLVTINDDDPDDDTASAATTVK